MELVEVVDVIQRWTDWYNHE